MPRKIILDWTRHTQAGLPLSGGLLNTIAPCKWLGSSRLLGE